MNTVIVERTVEETVPVESLPGGTLVTWQDYQGRKRVFIVVARTGWRELAAIAMDNGGYLSPGTRVTKLPNGTKIEVTTDEVTANAFGS